MLAGLQEKCREEKQNTQKADRREPIKPNQSESNPIPYRIALSLRLSRLGGETPSPYRSPMRGFGARSYELLCGCMKKYAAVCGYMRHRAGGRGCKRRADVVKSITKIVHETLTFREPLGQRGPVGGRRPVNFRTTCEGSHGDAAFLCLLVANSKPKIARSTRKCNRSNRHFSKCNRSKTHKTPVFIEL
jgi:hypothetical protein